MSELPKGWAIAEIKSIATDVVVGFVGTSKTHYRESGIPFLTGKNIKNGKIDLKKIDHVTSEFNDKERKSSLSPGDVVVVRIGRSGESAVVPDSLPVSNCGGLVVIKKPLAILPDILSHYLNSPEAINSSQLEARGATRQTLNTKNIAEKEVPLPPYAEQTRIAQKLNELLAQVGTLKARIDAIPTLLKRFRQSVLTAAVSGRLTVEWRDLTHPPRVNSAKIKDELLSIGITRGNFSSSAQTIEKDSQHSLNHTSEWPTLRIGDLCECIVPNRDKPKSFCGKIHWLVTENIAEHSIHISYGNIKYGLTPEEARKYRAKVIPKNSVLMTCIGRLGLSAITEEECVINQQLHAFLESKYLLPKFLAFAIRANKKYFEEKSTSTTVSYLNKTACNSMPIGLPTLDEQTEIVRRVEQLFAFADQLEAKVATAQARIDYLTQSILAKAFRGELVPQDPNDEPASLLLERIQAQRAAAPKAKRGSKASA